MKEGGGAKRTKKCSGLFRFKGNYLQLLGILTEME